jgi:hypothetical protein
MRRPIVGLNFFMLNRGEPSSCISIDTVGLIPSKNPKGERNNEHKRNL